MNIKIILILISSIFIVFILIKNLWFNKSKENNTGKDNNTNIKTKIIKIKNPIDNSDLFWEESNFVKNNFPNYDYEIGEKQKIFEYCKNNKYDYGVIDVGAHIGDLAIPLAMALKNINREDIIVYAIDPSLQKCNFMKKISKINNIKNIKILNYGLSNENKILSHDFVTEGNNTGGHIWYIKSNSINLDVSTYEKESNIFIKADDLLKKGDIGKIGVYHIDVESHELDVLKGSKELINKYKPILFIEVFADLAAVKKENCKNRQDCPEIFKTIEDIDKSYKNTGFLPNGDLIFENK
jgi:FkbM family methyltransferase